MHSLNRIYPELADYTDGMDHVDVKSARSNKRLSEVVTGLLSYRPGWLKALYGVRGLLVRLLGLRADHPAGGEPLPPSELPMTPGGKAGFFEVASAREDAWWIGEVNDTHLSAWVIVVREPRPEGDALFHLATSVRYRRWTGPLYFNLIRPFHHLVVRAMLRRATRNA